MSVDVLAAALDYARRGIPVFPVNPLNKRPLTTNGFHDATTNEQQIREWWKERPNAMIGTPTGAASGRWVLDPDIDPAKGIDGPASLAEITAQYGSLPPTVTSMTPRGGTHSHFRWNGVNIRNSDSKIGKGIDVRGEGGYAVLPPSVRSDGAAYRWVGSVTELAEAPRWLINLVMKSPRSITWARAALKSACQRVAAAAPGTRNSTLNSEAFSIFRIVAGGNLDESDTRTQLFQAACDCGLVDDDGAPGVENTLNSAANAGLAQPRYYDAKASSPTNSRGPTSLQLQLQPQPQPQPSSSSPPPQSPPPPSPPQPQPQPQPSRRAPGAKPVIRLIEGELPESVDKAEEALLTASRRYLYQRSTQIVRPIRPKVRAANSRWTYVWRLEAITKHHMIETFTRVAQFEKWDGRAQDFVVKNCPEQIAEVYLARVGQWKLPSLFGIVNAPFLRADGTTCEGPGYDPDNGLLYIPERGVFPPIPTNPSKGDAEAALQRLKDRLLAEFPFVADVDRSVALSAFLTAFDRHAMATAPLHAFTSPSAGTGKSLLVDLISILLSGRLAPVIAQGHTAEETEKRIASALLASDRIVSIDNCDRELDSALLCQALTQEQLNIRLLGYSRNVEVPVMGSFFATGNNLVVASDLTRRTLLCRLDAKTEQPELRDFKNNVLEVARTERGALAIDVLTILRAWHLDRTITKTKPFGSFEDWSYRVRQPLLWLGQVDPCDSIQTVRENDPTRALLDAVLQQWAATLGTKNAFTVRQIIARAMIDPDFYGALMAVASSPQGPGISNDRLGRWLSKNNGKISGKFKLIRAGTNQGYPLWRVDEV